MVNFMVKQLIKDNYQKEIFQLMHALKDKISQVDGNLVEISLVLIFIKHNLQAIIDLKWVRDVLFLLDQQNKV